MTLATLLLIIALILALLSAFGVGGRVPMFAIAVVLLCVVALLNGPLHLFARVG